MERKGRPLAGKRHVVRTKKKPRGAMATRLLNFKAACLFSGSILSGFGSFIHTGYFCFGEDVVSFELRFFFFLLSLFFFHLFYSII